MVKTVFTLGNMLLLALTGYLGVDLFYQSATERFQPAASQQAAVVRTEIPQVMKPPALAEYDVITTRNLFKIDSKALPVKPKPVSQKEEVLRPTRLKLKLWGTIVDEAVPDAFGSGATDVGSAATGNTYAVIQVGGKSRQDLYRVGSKIDKATIERIERERVVLNVNGQREVLKMEETSSGRASKRGAAPSRVAASQRDITLKRSVIEGATQNVAELMKQVRIRPHFQNGKPDGLQLSAIRPNSFLRQLGLHNGDVISGVNGTEIQSVDDVLKLYNGLKSESELSLDIKRRGKPQSISYRIE